MSGYVYQCEDAVEPISDTFGEQATNAGLYSIVDPQFGGCALTYSAGAMTVDLAAGQMIHYGLAVAVAAAPAGYTLVSDPTRPRWTWLALSSAGAPVVVSGDPAATPTVPEIGDRVAVALVYVQTALTIAANATYKLVKTVPTPGLVTEKHKTVAQVFTTNTTYADITASTGSMAFSIAANEIVSVRYILPLSFGGTGGVKLQLTGPGSPALVQAIGFGDSVKHTYTGATDAAQSQSFTSQLVGPTGAFSSNLIAMSSTGVVQQGNAGGATDGLGNAVTLVIDVLIVNGTNAGTVTLQGAQNSSNSTSTFNIGCRMLLTRRMGFAA